MNMDIYIHTHLQKQKKKKKGELKKNAAKKKLAVNNY